MATTPTSSGSASLVPLLSGDPVIDALIAGTKWGGPLGTSAEVSYSFPAEGSAWSTNPYSGYGSPAGNGEPWRSYALPDDDQRVFRLALERWASVADIRPEEVRPETTAVVGDIRVGYTFNIMSDTTVAHATTPASLPTGGDIWLNAKYQTSLFAAMNPGTYGFYVLLHELGHALGLKHPFEGTGASPVPLDRTTTVMSYTNTSEYESHRMGYYPTTPMRDDIAAMQYLYGPDMSHGAGNDTYVYHAGETYFETIWDAGGIDTIEYASAWRGGSIDLRPGHWSRLGLEREIFTASGTQASADAVMIYDSVVIENAIGGHGPDLIVGNEAANRLTGRGGDDTLDGGGGIDVAIYSGPRSAYSTARSSAHAIVAGPDGTDTLTNIERLAFDDLGVALDLAPGEAGYNTVRLIGAGLGAAHVIAPYVGDGLSLFDSGFTVREAAEFLLGTPAYLTLAGEPSDGAFVDTVYLNVIGTSPSDTERAYFLDLLHGKGGPMGQADLLLQAAFSDENAGAIGLPALQATGVDFA